VDLLAEMNFDSLELIKVPVTVKGVKYILQEASAGAGRDYRNAQMKTFKIADGKMVGMENTADLDLILVSLCLFKVMETHDTLEPMPLIAIQGWPDKVIKGLAARAKEISDLEDKDTVETIDKKIVDLKKKRDLLSLKDTPAKNELSAMATASA